MPPTLEPQNQNTTVEPDRENSPGTDILVIRSASRALDPAVTQLLEEFPNARILVLATSSGATPLKRDPRIHQVLPLKEGRRISWSGLPIETREFLNNQSFDLTVTLANSADGSGYSNVNRVALKCGAPKIRTYYPDGSYRTLDAKTVYRESLRELGYSGWVILNVLATLFLMVAASALILFEAMIRKLSFSRKKPAASESMRKSE